MPIPASLLVLTTATSGTSEEAEDHAAMIRDIPGTYLAFQAGRMIISLHADIHPNYPIPAGPVRRLHVHRSPADT
jgi:hypothetical protein